MHSSETSPNFPPRLMLKGLSSRLCSSIFLSFFFYIYFYYPLMSSLSLFFVPLSNLSYKLHCVFNFVFTFCKHTMRLDSLLSCDFIKACAEQDAENAHQDYNPSWFSHTINTRCCRFCNYIWMLPTSQASLKTWMLQYVSAVLTIQRSIYLYSGNADMLIRRILWAGLNLISLVSCNIQ